MEKNEADLVLPWRVVTEGFTDKVMSKLRDEGGEGVSLDFSGRAFRQKGQLVKISPSGGCA